MNTSLQNIVNDMINQEYKGTMKSRHLSVALCNNIPVTNYKYNYHQEYVFGEFRGTCHAEMSTAMDVLNNYSDLNGYQNYFPWVILKRKCLLLK
jgi:hypothetical protein